MRYPTRSRLFGRVLPFRLLRLAGAGVIAAFLWAMAGRRGCTIHAFPRRGGTY
jgi:hypothetical protein